MHEAGALLSVDSTFTPPLFRQWGHLRLSSGLEDGDADLSADLIADLIADLRGALDAAIGPR